MCVYVTDHVRSRASYWRDVRLRDRLLGNAVEDQVVFEFLIVNKVTIGLRFQRRSILIRPDASSFSNTRRFISRLTPYRTSLMLDSGNVVLSVFQAMCSSRIQTMAPRVPVALAASAAHCNGTLTNCCCFLASRAFMLGVSSVSTRIRLPCAIT